jgi:hypothetical protein
VDDELFDGHEGESTAVGSIEQVFPLAGHVPRAAIPTAAIAEAMLAAVPGLSTVTARALLARFGSVAGVAAAARTTG